MLTNLWKEDLLYIQPLCENSTGVVTWPFAFYLDVGQPHISCTNEIVRLRSLEALRMAYHEYWSSWNRQLDDRFPAWQPLAKSLSRYLFLPASRCILRGSILGLPDAPQPNDSV